MADRAIADWQARQNDLQRNIDLMHTQTQETLLNTLTEKYIGGIEDKNKEIVELLKEKAKLTSQLRHCSSPEEVKKLQNDLKKLIDTYQNAVKRRVDLIEKLMDKIREYMQLQEDILGCEEDIERVKSLIYLGEQDNKFLREARDDLIEQLHMIHEKTAHIVTEQNRYRKVIDTMDYAWSREEDELNWLRKMIMVREEELSWWQYEWEDHTHPFKPEFQWVLAPTMRATKNQNHVALMHDRVDVSAA